MEGEEEREARIDALHQRLDQLSRGGQRGRGPRRADDTPAPGDEDARIWNDVSACLTDDWYVDGTEITVSVDSGEVTLDRVVENRAEKRLADDCTDSVRGVVNVHNHLRIRRPDKVAGDAGPDLLSRRTAF